MKNCIIFMHPVRSCAFFTISSCWTRNRTLKKLLCKNWCLLTASGFTIHYSLFDTSFIVNELIEFFFFNSRSTDNVWFTDTLKWLHKPSRFKANIYILRIWTPVQQKYANYVYGYWRKNFTIMLLCIQVLPKSEPLNRLTFWSTPSANNILYVEPFLRIQNLCILDHASLW